MRPASTTIGFGAQTVNSHAVADDFSVAGADWNVSGFSFFAYQTFANSAFTFTQVTWSIIAGDVNTGTVVASGSQAPTNGGLLGYRVIPGDLGDRDRAIFQLDLDVPDFLLSAGGYWLRWSMAGSGQLAGPWQPPTADGEIGNAMQSLNGGAFNTAIDNGDGLGVEFPFIIRGASTVVPEPSTWSMMFVGGIAMLGLARRRRRMS
jgi:hypothetical protein